MRKWIVKEPSEQRKIGTEHKIPEPILNILFDRGYNSSTKINKFLNPSLTDLNDPFLFRDMEKAVDRILAAVSNKERILIFGDYDVDGVTGTALLIKALSELDGKLNHYIPHRIKEGYGFSTGGVEYARKIGASLIITVDCGITAQETIGIAKAGGADVIICDHHAADSAPDAYAVLNPKVDDHYPFTELAGCGVAFKLVHALYIKLKRPEDEIYKYLDIVSLGTIADVSPLVDENRIITRYGLERLSRTDNLGLRNLIEATGITDRKFTSYHAGYILGPRINAAGRIAEADKGLRLILTDDPNEARSLALHLNQINQDRKDIENEILEDALIRAEREGIKGRVVVLANENWHEGVIGIVASRISEKFFRPTFLISITADQSRGSARGIKGFDVFGALKAAAPTLIEYGGHKEAGGFSLQTERIGEFRSALEEFALNFPEEIFQPSLFIDFQLELGIIDEDFLRHLLRFEPTGVGNPRPSFLTRDVLTVGYPKIVGSDHLRFAVMKNNHHQQAIYYQQGSLIEKLEVGKSTLDIVYTVDQDQIAVRPKPILKIRDMRIRGVDS
ncbi:MAG TPA: single-stranded-DNA-specific exonuclease RecJ [bacterium (Candidatus Stahlbacteria)]|nr:single-stranded-DNA-specific exonuclease RecJ [Candidatus Stahlbacteria bacterium]